MNLDAILGGRGRAPPPDPLDAPLLELVPGKEVLTARALCEGVLCLGSTGSGKTSGSGRALRDALLRAGYGGIVLTVKDDAADFVAAMRAAGREGDLVLFGPEHAATFNPFEHERVRGGRGGGLVENVVAILSELEALAEPGAGKDSSDAYFRLATRDLARFAIGLLLHAEEPLRIGNLYKLLAHAPTSTAQAGDKQWRKDSYTYALLMHAQALMGPDTEEAVRRLQNYFLQRFAAMPDKTRACVSEGLLARLSVLSQGHLGRLFGGDTTWTPAELYRGKVVVVDMPVLHYGEMGRLGNVLMKAVVMRDVQRRPVDAATQPVFIWSDEYQYLMTPGDQLFLTTARSARAISVFLTQNISNLSAALGGGREADPVVASLLGNLRTKIVHAVEEQETVTYLADLIGYEYRMLTGVNVPAGATGERMTNLNQQRALRIEPSDFQTLKTGGPHNGYLVEGVVYRGGQRFANNRTYLKVTFDQRTGRAV